MFNIDCVYFVVTGRQLASITISIDRSDFGFRILYLPRCYSEFTVVSGIFYFWYLTVRHISSVPVGFKPLSR